MTRNETQPMTERIGKLKIVGGIIDTALAAIVVVNVYFAASDVLTNEVDLGTWLSAYAALLYLLIILVVYYR